MAAARKPTAVLDLSGAFKKHPERKRARQHEPQPEAEVGDAPEHFTADQTAVWNELVADAAPGVLTSMDRKWVEMTAVLFVEFRNGDGDVAKLMRLLAGMGFNPCEPRQAVAIPKK